jgi:hypothetical protein
MIRLKNKKAAEEKRIAEEATATSTSTDEVAAGAGPNGAVTPDTVTSSETMRVEESSEQGAVFDSGLKLLGIGGKSSRSADPAVKRGGKRKTPG